MTMRGLLRAARPLFAAATVAAPAWGQADTGAANFTRYVALGDSLTAAFTSGGLAQSAQVNSYPALIHRQATGGGGFEQPLVGDPGLPALLELRSLDPIVIAPIPGQGAPLNLLLGRPYDNLGVPGADVHDAVATVTDDGGAHDLVLRGLGTQLQQAAALAPTFATVWLGNNDALSAATSGRVIEGVTLTPVASFENDYRLVLTTLAAAADLAVATIPNVTSIPFVTTIDPFLAVPGIGDVPLIGPAGALSPDDFVLLTASQLIAQGVGVPASLGGTGRGLPDEVVLSAAEAAAIQERVGAYNAIIRAAAGEVGAALVDVNAVFDRIVRDGQPVGGLDYNAEFLAGGIFSYDGVHPTPFGYAIIANEFIRAINEAYDGNIPAVDLFDFVFGEAGRAPQLIGDPLFVFAPAAWAGLEWGLGAPQGALGDPVSGPSPHAVPGPIDREPVGPAFGLEPAARAAPGEAVLMPVVAEREKPAVERRREPIKK